MSGSFDNSSIRVNESSASSSSKRVWEGAAFFSSLGLLVILNLVVKPVWIFFIDRKVQLETGPAEYGSYFAILSLSIILSFFLDFGFTAYFNRQLAFHRENFITQTGNFLLLKILLILLYAAMMLGIAWVWGIQETSLLVSMILIQSLTSLFLFFRSVITAQQWFRTDAWLSVLDKTLLILVCGSLLYFPAVFETITIKKFLVMQMACTGLATACALGIILRRGTPFIFNQHFFISRKLMQNVLPFGIIILLMGMHYRLDGFLLERLKGPEEAGLYAAAYRLLDAANMVGFLFASFLLPYIASLLQEKKAISPVVLYAQHALVLYSTFVIILVVFLSPWINQLLYREQIPGAKTILAWTMPALLGYSLVQVYGTALTAAGLIRQFCLIAFFSVIFNIALNLLLIPPHGALGACYSAIISHSIFGIGCMVYCSNKMNIRISSRSWFIYLCAALVLTFVFIGGKYIGLSYEILLLVGIMIFLGFFFLFRAKMLNYWLKLKTSVT